MSEYREQALEASKMVACDPQWREKCQNSENAIIYCFLQLVCDRRSELRQNVSTDRLYKASKKVMESLENHPLRICDNCGLRRVGATQLVVECVQGNLFAQFPPSALNTEEDKQAKAFVKAKNAEKKDKRKAVKTTSSDTPAPAKRQRRNAPTVDDDEGDEVATRAEASTVDYRPQYCSANYIYLILLFKALRGEGRNKLSKAELMKEAHRSRMYTKRRKKCPDASIYQRSTNAAAYGTRTAPTSHAHDGWSNISRLITNELVFPIDKNKNRRKDDNQLFLRLSEDGIKVAEKLYKEVVMNGDCDQIPEVPVETQQDMPTPRAATSRGQQRHQGTPVAAPSASRRQTAAAHAAGKDALARAAAASADNARGISEHETPKQPRGEPIFLDFTVSSSDDDDDAQDKEPLRRRVSRRPLREDTFSYDSDCCEFDLTKDDVGQSPADHVSPKFRETVSTLVDVLGYTPQIAEHAVRNARVHDINEAIDFITAQEIQAEQQRQYPQQEQILVEETDGVAAAGGSGVRQNADSTNNNRSSSHRLPTARRLGFSSLRLPPLSSGKIFAEEYDLVLLIDGQEKFSIHAPGYSTPASSPSEALARHVEELRSTYGLRVEVRSLPTGDALWIARRKYNDEANNNRLQEYVLDTALERKTCDDMVKSIRDGRYRLQKFVLKRCGVQNLYYVLEGNIKFVGSGNETERKMVDTAAVSTENEGFKVLRTRDVSRTFEQYQDITREIERVCGSCISSGSVAEVAMTYEEFKVLCKKAKDLSKSELGKVLLKVRRLPAHAICAILEKYTSPESLMGAYNDCLSSKGDARFATAEGLLADLKDSKTGEAVGHEVSKKVFQELYLTKLIESNN